MLISNQKAASLTPTYMVPFVLVSLTDNGNATVQSDDNNNRPVRRRTIRRERLVPYRYEYRCYDDTTLDNSSNSSSSSPAAAGL